MEMSRATEADCGAPRSGEQCRKGFVLDRFPMIIGRGSEVDIHVEDRWGSRRHCEITEVDGALMVRDLGSTHGTLVNGVLQEESRLEIGDQLTVGLSTLVVSAVPSSGASALGSAQTTVGRLAFVPVDTRCRENGVTDRVARSKPR